MSIVDLPGQFGQSDQSGPPLSPVNAPSGRSPAPSLATGERVGSRADYGKLAAFALAELADSLACPCAAIVARIASAPEQWHAVSVTIRGAATHDFRRHDQRACAKAADALGSNDPIDAALILARAAGEELSEWHSRVTRDMASARVQGIAQGAARGPVTP